MTDTNITGAERIPVTAVLARLILLADRKRLPEPKAIEARRFRSDHLGVSVELGSLNDLRAWCKAADGRAGDIRAMDVPANHYCHHSVRLLGWLGCGWDVEFTCNVELPQASTPLDAETIAALGRVACPGCTDLVADAACPEHGVKAFLVEQFAQDAEVA